MVSVFCLPDWLAAKRATQVEVGREERRIKSLHAYKRRAREESDVEPDA